MRGRKRVRSVAVLLAANAHFKANPTTRYDIGVWPPESWDYADFRVWFRKCLDDKINRGDGRTGRKHDQQYQWDLEHDKRMVEDYLYHRIRHSGCSGLLRTREMQRRYPQINRQERMT